MVYNVYGVHKRVSTFRLDKDKLFSCLAFTKISTLLILAQTPQ